LWDKHGLRCSSAPGVASDVPNITSSTVPEELVPEEESFSTRIQRLYQERDALKLTLKLSKKRGGSGVMPTEAQKSRLKELQQLLKVM